MNKNKFVFMVKTFRNDFLALKRLLSTFQKFNRDGIKLFLVLPSDDAKEMLDTFPCELFVNTEVLHEEFFSCYTATTPVNGVRPGYVNQEIIKLAFHEICPAENFMPVDSDGEFLRDFYYSDFIASDGYPFSVLVEDNELKIDPEYWYEVGWLGRENNIRQIYDHIDFHPDIMLTAHGFCIMNVGVLSDLRKKFIEKKFGEFSPLNSFSLSGGTNVVTVKNTGGGYIHYDGYIHLLELCGYEFSWYNMWLQKTQLIPLHIREPLFRCFHTYKQFLRLKWQGITREDIARGYVGMVVNSNFQPNRGEDGPLEYETENYPRIIVGEPSAKVCVNFLCKKTIRAIVRSLRKIKWFITKIPRIPHKLKKIIFR